MLKTTRQSVLAALAAIVTLVAGTPAALSSTWDDILAAAKGTTVNFYMWSGDDRINASIDEWVGSRLLGWSEQRAAEEVEAYRSFVSRFRVCAEPSASGPGSSG